MMEGTVPIPNVGSNPTPVITKEGEIIMPMVIPVLFLIIVGISTVFLVFFKLVDGNQVRVVQHINLFQLT